MIKPTVVTRVERRRFKLVNDLVLKIIIGRKNKFLNLLQISGKCVGLPLNTTFMKCQNVSKCLIIKENSRK